jgi:dTDP-4-dehydrorhamnose 3,5-epimerase
MSFVFKHVEELPGLVIIDCDTYGDERGFFMERYKHSDFKNAGILELFVQENFSHSGKGVIRGLHYQEGDAAQGKLVRCVRGAIFDVAVDIRKDSKYFGKWFGVELSESNHRQLYIPTGFAHGFAVLGDTADVNYLCTQEYSKINERGVIWSDETVSIPWPIKNPVVSDKDASHPRLKDL